METNYDCIETPALIIGAGAAGLRTAIALADRGMDCLVIGKRRHGDAHTRLAAGGINASLGHRDPQDRWTYHAADTLREGHFICDPHAVEYLCRNAPDRVRELQSWGCPFSLMEDGRIDQRYFGAQTFRRTCFVGDRTGEAILATLVDRAQHLRIPWRDQVFISRLLVEDGVVGGALGFDTGSGRYLVFRAKAVVMAAGGFTRAYARSTSRPHENTGDSMALAYLAGATLRDMEFVQFHPTGMVAPPSMAGDLVTEAVRGEGGRLFNAEGERFMERYSPRKKELDARDVVARAIYRELQAGRGTPSGGVWLDISHRDPRYIQERLPKMVGQFRDNGIDITREPMEVAPTAHYPMGGIQVDFQTGATGVPGLFAVGEATAGVHGANRLGGNSLAETLVFGERTGAFLSSFLVHHPFTPVGASSIAVHLKPLEGMRNRSGHAAAALVQTLQALLWNQAGIVRSKDGLESGLEKLRDLQSQASALGGSRPDELAGTLHIQFMLMTAEAIFRSALQRDESRGAHYREDAPEEQASGRRNILCRGGDRGEITLWSEPVPEIPGTIQNALDEELQADYHHLE